MRTFRIDQETSLGAALREHRVLQYQVGILIECGAVFVSRSNGTIPSPLDERTHLTAGDLVSIEDPLPEKCQAALARMEFGDYAFVPGGTLYDEDLATTLGLRPQTVVLGAFSLRNFIEILAKSSRLTRPIRALIIGSHASRWGGLDIPMDAQTGEVTYEELINARNKGSIKVPSDLVALRPKDKSGAIIPVTVHVRGCLIGQDIPFLQMLKTALSVDLVTAPRHFHVVAQLRRPPGRVEYMNYNFRISRKAPLKTRDQVLRQFAISQSPRIDNQSVPVASWPKWLPKKVNVRIKDERQPVSVEVISPLTGQRELWDGFFVYQIRNLWERPKKLHCKEDPRTEEKRRAFVRDFLEKDPLYSPDYDSPMYKRYECQSLDEFMDTWKWQITWIEADKVLEVQAERHEYIIAPPITDPKTGTVFMNFYPTHNPRAPGIEPEPVIQMPEDDVRFFGRA